MTWVLAGCAAITVVAVWFAVFAVRRWLWAMRKLVAWQEQWNIAPEQCRTCGSPEESPEHVPDDMEARLTSQDKRLHRYAPARIVTKSPGVLLPVRGGAR